jgi:hypothetical protein
VSLGADFSLRGTPFVRPASCWGVAADGDRLAGALLSAGAHRQGDDEIRYALEPGCVDLSRVRAGRAPLLLEHRPYLDSLAGLVPDAWLDGPTLACAAGQIVDQHLPRTEHLSGNIDKPFIFRILDDLGLRDA